MHAPVVRTVLVRFAEPHRTDADRRAVVDAARAAFPGFPGVVDVRAGIALDEDQDVLLLVGFARGSDVEPYRTSPGHVAFLEQWLRPRGATVLARTFLVDAA